MAEPWETSQQITFILVLNALIELRSRVAERGVHVRTRIAASELFIPNGFEVAHIGCCDACRENHRFAFLHRQFEIARYKVVFLVSKAALLLFLILDALVPQRVMHISAFLGELHVESGKLRIHLATAAVDLFAHVGYCTAVLVRQLIYAAESEERTEAKRGCRMGFEQRVTNQYAGLKTYEHTLFLKNHATYTVHGFGNDLAVKLTDVLVSVGREIVITILVDAEVKFGSMLNNRFIKRREQNVIVI